MSKPVPPSTGKSTIGIKLMVVCLVGLLLMIPLTMVRALVSERASAKDEVVRDIARTAADLQRITLPVIVVPYTRRWVETTETTDTTNDREQKKVTRKERVEVSSVQFLPENVSVEAAPAVEQKHRGLYSVLTYVTPVRIKGRFSIPADYGPTPGSDMTITWGAPLFALGVSDPRGIKNNPVLKWNGASLRFAPGTGGDTTRLGGGISLPLDSIKRGTAQEAEFSLDLDLMGMERLSFIPTARETQVAMKAGWSHPSFFGKFSPKSEVDNTAKTFSAEWKTSFFSTNAPQAYASCVQRDQCGEFAGNEFGVSLIQPADLYLQLERAAKYGFLFVGLTFAAFFLFEVLKSLAVHPVQYGLVGLALAMFYVLLVSLSEHYGFNLAYVAASCACVGLIVLYLGAVLASWLRALGVGAMLAALYGVLFMLLRSEDSALLMGSLFLFVLLAAVMLGTRRIDWYKAGRRVTGGEASVELPPDGGATAAA